jgi:ubiquinone/menaquinone biosynthesis C-methylase UbiE
MVEAARRRAVEQEVSNATFLRMDAEALDLPDAVFDVVLCSLGLMYVPDPQRAVREWRRVLKPGGRVAIAVWGKRSNCGWSPVFPIVEQEVESDVCPLFFSLGEPDVLAQLCADSGFDSVRQRRIPTILSYDDAQSACDAAFVGGPVALAWSRFDAETRERARSRYQDAIEPWRRNQSYRIPGEFVVVTGVAPGSQ